MMKGIILAALVCVVTIALPSLTLSAENGGAKQTAATYVGNEVCKACHATQFEKFAQTQMGKIFLFNPRDDREGRACENCHGPGSNHASAGGGKGVGGMLTFRKDSGESPKVQNEACLQCHQRGIQTYWEASAHASRGSQISPQTPRAR